MPVVGKIPKKVDIDFKSPQVFKDIESYFKQVVLFDLVLQSYNFVRNFELYLIQNPDFTQVKSDIYNKYQNILVQAKFIALPMLKENEIIELLRNHFIDTSTIPDYDLWQKIKAKLVTIVVIAERDVLRKNIIDALKYNNQFLTIDDIKIGELVVKPTVANWLKDYSVMFGIGKVETVKQVQYVTNSNNTRLLKNDERDRLKKLISLYERLKYSSTEPGGIEEGYSMVIDGKWKTLDPEQAIWEERDKKVRDLEPFIKKAFELLQSLASTNEGNVKLKPAVTNVIPPMNLVQVAPSTFRQPTPAFLFDEADEREADRYRERMANGEWRMAKNLESRLRGLAEEVIKEHNFSFKDEVSHKRFVQLFVSFLKDVRDVIEAREMLLKSTESGGLGLTSDKAEKVIEILQQAKKRMANGEWPMAEEKIESRIKNQELGIGTKDEILRSAQNDAKSQADIIHKPKTELDKIIEADRYSYGIKNQELGIKKPELEIKKPEVAAPKSTSEETAITRGYEPKITPPAPSDAAKAEVLRQQILEQIVSKIEADKAAPAPPPEPLVRPRLVDVKAPPRVLGPLEELRTLSVVDFRRLSDNPVEALNKINKKIDIVGEASIGKRVEAVRAWQASPVYQLYLKIGRASIETSQSVADIIAEQAQKNETTLSEDEFNAVADFNERIRF